MAEYLFGDTCTKLVQLKHYILKLEKTIMKNLTKLVATASFAVATLFASSQVKAQTTTPSNQWRFGIGVEAGVPTGNLDNVSNFVLGGTAKLQYGLSQDLAFTLTSGYYNAFGQKVGNTNLKYQSIGIVPLKAGIKAYTGSPFYISAEVGAGFETKGLKDTKLIASPGIGYSWDNVDLGVRYENFSGQNNNYGMVAARLAYGFKL
jgi:hypothetical protein